MSNISIKIMVGTFVSTIILSLQPRAGRRLCFFFRNKNASPATPRAENTREISEKHLTPGRNCVMIVLHNAQISEKPISHLYSQYTTHCAAAQARKTTNSQHVRVYHFRALQDILHSSAAVYHRQYRCPEKAVAPTRRKRGAVPDAGTVRRKYPIPPPPGDEYHVNYTSRKERL